MVDQRGTGRSAPVGTLPGMSPKQQADHLTNFRADSIVRDLEHVRTSVYGGRRWATFAQSYGGWITLCYLSQAPEGLAACYVAGGIPGTPASAAEVYRRTFTDLYSEGCEVRRVSTGRALAHALIEVDRPRVTYAVPTGRRPDYSEVVSSMAPEHAIPMLLVGVLGLSYKPKTDDMREAPSIEIIRALVSKGARVRAYDPVAMEQAKKVLPDLEYAVDEYEAAEGADVLVFMTEWNEFRALDMQKIKGLMRTPRIADLRNIYEPQRMRELGFDYVGVGR